MKLSDFFKGRPKRARVMSTRLTLGGRESPPIESEELRGLPTISDQAVREIAKVGWPANEEQTTAEVYAAAEAIREKRPRDPVGYATGGLVEIAVASMDRLDGRSSRGVRSKS